MQRQLTTKERGSITNECEFWQKGKPGLEAQADVANSWFVTGWPRITRIRARSEELARPNYRIPEKCWYFGSCSDWSLVKDICDILLDVCRSEEKKTI